MAPLPYPAELEEMLDLVEPEVLVLLDESIGQQLELAISHAFAEGPNAIGKYSLDLGPHTGAVIFALRALGRLELAGKLDHWEQTGQLRRPT